jgi:hypothetical protein
MNLLVRLGQAYMTLWDRTRPPKGPYEKMRDQELHALSCTEKTEIALNQILELTPVSLDGRLTMFPFRYGIGTMIEASHIGDLSAFGAIPMALTWEINAATDGLVWESDPSARR